MTGAASSAAGPNVTTHGVPEEPAGAEGERDQDQAASPARNPSTGYRAGPLSWLLGRLDRLPGHGWWVVALFALALIAWGLGTLWATGQIPFGELDLNVIILSAYGPYALGAMMLGLHVALGALQTFWPATGWPRADQRAWIYQFKNAPARLEVVAMGLGVVGALAALIAAPATVLPSTTNSLDYYLAIVPIFIAGYGLASVGIIVSARWLWLVMRIHREATAIDPFDRAPLYAFSRLTVLAGLAYVIAIYYTFTVNAAYQVGNVPSLAFLGANIVAGVAAFVVPLWGIHTRIAREKEALLHDVEQRIERVAAELYSDIDAGSFDAAGKYSSLLSILGTLRERIAHLPTWPWPPNLFRGFVTALLLPILIFVLTRVISTYLS